MRLIDADALLENYDLKNATKYGNKTAEQQHNSYSTLMLYEVADLIDDAPTIDAEPVRHGQLVSTGFDEIYCEWGDCTVCGADNRIDAKFCNNCGAKIEGTVAK